MASKLGTLWRTKGMGGGGGGGADVKSVAVTEDA